MQIHRQRLSGALAIVATGLLSVGTGGDASAQKNINGQINTITTAVPFLRISPDARSGGMGDVGIAISPDANAQYWNVAKLPFATKKFGISATYTPWLKDLVPDIYLAYLSAYGKFGQDGNQAISGSLRYFSLGEINYTDINANPTGTGLPREFSLDLGYSRRLSTYLSAGLSLRYIHSSIATGLAQSGIDYHPGNTVAADLGVYYTKTTEINDNKKNTFSAGAVISNLGGKISYTSTRKDFIPINLGLGAAYTMQIDEYNKLTFALDVNKLLVPTPLDSFDNSANQTVRYYPDKPVVSGVFGSFSDAPGGASEEFKELDVSVGAEYWYQDQFAVRAGYFYEDKTKGDRKYLTVGIGTKYSVFTLNASYLIPGNASSGVRNPLSNTLRFSLLFDFDKASQATADDSGQ